MKIYCLFCETRKAGIVLRIAEDRFGCKGISPLQTQHTWSRGRMIDRERELLPGYLFLYFDEGIPAPDKSELSDLDGVIRCLHDTAGQCELTGRDAQFAMMLLDKGGRIGKTQVFREGQRIRIRDGMFEGLETRILKVDHRASRMQVEIPFANQMIRTWLEYELAEPDNG